MIPDKERMMDCLYASGSYAASYAVYGCCTYNNARDCIISESCKLFGLHDDGPGSLTVQIELFRGLE